MELNDLRIGVTLVSLVLFIALVLHTWSRRRVAEHSAAAALPFTGEDAARAERELQGERGE
jgi:hypothetical protein